MLKFMTAGESHGDSLLGILEGIPANLDIDVEYINSELARRQGGYGRGARMKIEKDRVIFLSGVSKNKTTGNPISIMLENKGTNIDLVEVKEPRPGHADLPGLLKYNQKGGRNILERASARETAVRVSLGSIAKLLLREFDIEIYSHLVQVGSVKSDKTYYTSDILDDIKSAKEFDMNVLDKELEDNFIKEIKEIEKKKDSVGGKIELIAINLPVGLGSHISWDRRLDGLLSQALMSIPAIKGVNIGLGFDGVDLLGSKYHDEIKYDKTFKRYSNNAGGIEGGMSNGEDIVMSIVMKPIPTLKIPLKTINIDSKEESVALVERADTIALSAASVVAESMVALVLADEMLRKFGGDSMEELRSNYHYYLNQVNGR